MNILVHIVAWNSKDALLEKSIQSLLEQNVDGDLDIEITDNASTDGTPDILAALQSKYPEVKVYFNRYNLGFCGGHNQAIARFLRGSYDAFLALNPDAFLEKSALSEMVGQLGVEPRRGAVTPKLLRCEPSGEATEPAIIDAAGMCLTKSLRHFDRGSGELDRGQWNRSEEVFGGTGACLLLSRRCIEELLLHEDPPGLQSLASVFPQLAPDSSERKQLFDEAFFAFREDADLSWRLQTLGFSCVYNPRAVVYHVRRVTPERRKDLSADINRHSVRNRFLLQLNNLVLCVPLSVAFHGLIVRNVLVVLGVIFSEHSSIRGLVEVVKLSGRALRHRRGIVSKPGSDGRRALRWMAEN